MTRLCSDHRRPRATNSSSSQTTRLRLPASVGHGCSGTCGEPTWILVQNAVVPCAGLKQHRREQRACDCCPSSGSRRSRHRRRAAIRLGSSRCRSSAAERALAPEAALVPAQLHSRTAKSCARPFWWGSARRFGVPADSPHPPGHLACIPSHWVHTRFFSFDCPLRSFDCPLRQPVARPHILT